MMIGYLDAIIEGSIDEYMAAFDSYLNQMYMYQRIKVAGLIIVLLFVLIFVWMPYLRRLTSQIFRTKGLLNMIPMEILLKNNNEDNQPPPKAKEIIIVIIIIIIIIH